MEEGDTYNAVIGALDSISVEDTSKKPVKLSKSRIRERKKQEKIEKRRELRLAEQRTILFARYQRGTMKQNKKRADHDARLAVEQEETGLSRSDICKKKRREKRKKKKALIAAEQHAKREATQKLADMEALLVEKEAELLAVRDAAYRDALLAAEKIAFLEERMDDLLVPVEDVSAVGFQVYLLGRAIRQFPALYRLPGTYYLLRLRILFKPKEVKAKILVDWGEDLCPIGANPFELMSVHRSWTSVDDIYYNGYVRNSSYAKALDAARLKLVLKAFPAFARSGGCMALGSTHFHFIRKIPFLRSYEIRLSIEAWDQTR
ncbi:uncharacterized protein EDB93DRAFT_1108619 [Suillus bovinus]|uniref:uncharacterized protein n=1 Tax=Suillus bovinus TaxID=48563 RepID=UPI001B8629EA|nr:uncharacterized protein EDB93DRAFT_1108619 [Suillus bovinus]KAG2129693.1 hypothetical protein EDB93DRAFT_1108619 [Suillus bovinus]